MGATTGYFGSDPGEILQVPAGTAVIFSALTLHGSGDNLSAAPRRALNLAFGQGLAENQNGMGRANTRVPFLVGGEVVDSARALRRQVPKL